MFEGCLPKNIAQERRIEKASSCTSADICHCNLSAVSCSFSTQRSFVRWNATVCEHVCLKTRCKSHVRFPSVVALLSPSSTFVMGLIHYSTYCTPKKWVLCITYCCETIQGTDVVLPMSACPDSVLPLFWWLRGWRLKFDIIEILSEQVLKGFNCLYIKIQKDKPKRSRYSW